MYFFNRKECKDLRKGRYVNIFANFAITSISLRLMDLLKPETCNLQPVTSNNFLYVIITLPSFARRPVSKH